MGTTESILSSEEGSNTSLDGSRSTPSEHSSARQSARPRPKLTHSEVLHGIVLGLPASGKRTLLQRLQGRDPFQVRDQQLPTKVVVPYQPPSTRHRIRLEVKIPSSLEKADFAIFLIHPNHNYTQHVQPYIEHVIQKILMPVVEKKKKKAKKVTPFCLCVMVNFRDAASEEQTTALLQKVKGIINNSDVQSYPADRVVLKYATTSLFNCFGLNALHEFIHETYLQNKQYDLEQQLHETRQQLKQMSKIAVTVESYNDFLTRLDESENDRSEDVKHTEPPARRQAHENERHAKPADEEKEDHRERRQFMMSGAQPTTTTSYHEDPRSALEAFFEEESEANNAAPSPATNHLSQIDNDDDDDDYYYDEAGTRCGTHAHVGADSSSDEEESSKMRQPSVRNTRHVPAMPVIKESQSREEASSSDQDGSEEKTRALRQHQEENASDKQDTDHDVDISVTPVMDDFRSSETKEPGKAQHTEAVRDTTTEGDDQIRGVNLEKNVTTKQNDKRSDIGTIEDRVNADTDIGKTATDSSDDQEETLHAEVASKTDSDETIERRVEKDAEEAIRDPQISAKEDTKDIDVHDSPRRIEEHGANETLPAQGSEKKTAELSSSHMKTSAKEDSNNKYFQGARTRIEKEEANEISPTQRDEKKTDELYGGYIHATTNKSDEVNNSPRQERENENNQTPDSQTVADDEDQSEKSGNSPDETERIITAVGSNRQHLYRPAHMDEANDDDDSSSIREQHAEALRGQSGDYDEFNLDSAPVQDAPSSRLRVQSSPSGKASKPLPTTTTISAEARAAIDAAQREAELMLEQEQMEPRKKAKKKKKDQSEKKKKKKNDPERAEKKRKKKEKKSLETKELES